MQNFIKKYCTEEEIGEEGIFTIQADIDPKVLELIRNDISGQSLSGGLQKILAYCNKTYSGYSLKSLLKKFMGIFMKYYTEIYKYVKSNHPETATMMVQPHNIMREIKSTFEKYM